MTASASRRLAVRMLGEVRRRDAYAHEVLSSLLGRSELSPEDRAFATRLAYGTVSATGTLDEVLARYIRKQSGLEPQVADALRVAAYEILFLETARHAAVSQGVELVREARPQAAGLANAVLRRLAEDASQFPFDEGDEVATLSRATAHPRWLVELLLRDLGPDDARIMLAADNEPAPLYLAVTAFSGMSLEEATAALESAGAEARPCPVAGCIEAGGASSAVGLSHVRDRRILTTDAAAQLVSALVRPAPGQTIVEVGAGRGTKSLLLQSHAVNRGGSAEVYAVDKDAHKLETLSRDAAKLGASGIHTVTCDLLADDCPGMPAQGTCDAVLVDAPCSGLGTLRRHPDKRWRMRPEDLEALSVLGASLLAASAPLVRIGGTLVYATCTVARAENEDVIASFLQTDAGRGFAVDAVTEDVPDEWRRFVTAEGYLRTLPEHGGPDGHFAARLVRTA